ncbi:MAG: response regulator [Alphaproteobacteria bacterium]|nr:response regulator [Alphaproteobacteria bacterium]
MSPTILVVDDEPDLQSLVTQKFRRQIRKGEFEFLFARDGVEALELINQHPNIDVVLSDINMPRMDGLTLLRHLGELDQNLRAVIVSAYGDMGNIRTAMNSGAFDFVTKPIDLDDLEVTIHKTLNDLAVLREALTQRLEAETARANLARYFAPSMVDELAKMSDPFAAAQECQVAILFVDIIGFTGLAARGGAETTFALLREFHSRMAGAVFAADGSVDKYLGDGLMAIFGAPQTSGQDASNAIRCALAMQESMLAFNAARATQGEPMFEIAIGIHYGPVLIGNIGNEQRLEFATLGDTVNSAARLEPLARPLRARIVASDDVVQAVGAEGGTALLSDFVQHGAETIRGQDEPMQLWILPRATT